MDNLNVRLKPTVLIYQISNTSVVLRFCSEIINIDDEKGDVKFFFSLLDGRFTSDQILTIFSERYPDSAGAAHEYLNVVNELKLIEYVPEDAACLDQAQANRYSRNIEFFNSALNLGVNKFNVQKKLLESKVAVLGCGGLGSHIIMELAALGVGGLTIVDFDTIELSNLNRQILYREADLGSKKVFKARENILKFNARLNIKAIEKRIGCSEDIMSLVRGHDLVICAADKPRHHIVKWLNEACCSLGVPYINGGLDIRNAIFYSVIPGKSGCTECWKNSLPQEKRQIINADDESGHDYSVPAPALSALVSVAAGVMVCEAIKILTDIQPPVLINNLKCFSFDDLMITKNETWERSLTCDCCGNK